MLVGLRKLMKTIMSICPLVLFAFVSVIGAEITPAADQAKPPLKVALLDFDNQASVSSDANLVGGVSPQALAGKGAFALSSLLANDQGFVLIDRRDFLRQMETIKLKDENKPTNLKPSFLRAAQALNAGAVLRGTLLSYSPGKQIVNQGGMKTEFTTLALRVNLQALDTRDGAVIASVDGAAGRDFRQSAVQQTVVGEDQLLDLLQSAMKKAVPALNQALQARLSQERNRPTVQVSVKTSADPALVEIDGILIGTTPLNNFQVYAGDHIITVGKAGYQDVTKPILLKDNVSLEIPIFRTKLSAEELKQILEKARVNVIAGTADPAVIIGTIDAESVK